MLNLKCSTPDTVKVSAMKPFQGELKKRSEQDVKDLAQSLLEDGLLMPFVLWQHDGALYVLDGHGRIQAIVYIASNNDPTVLEQEFPCILIEAANEDEARKALLQIVSTYGRITKKGVLEFSRPVVNYKAPVVQKALISERRKKIDPDEGKVIVKLKIHRDQAAQLMSLLRQVTGVEVL